MTRSAPHWAALSVNIIFWGPKKRLARRRLTALVYRCGLNPPGATWPYQQVEKTLVRAGAACLCVNSQGSAVLQLGTKRTGSRNSDAKSPELYREITARPCGNALAVGKLRR
jgi:hypothetical protein